MGLGWGCVSYRLQGNRWTNLREIARWDPKNSVRPLTNYPKIKKNEKAKENFSKLCKGINLNNYFQIFVLI